MKKIIIFLCSVLAFAACTNQLKPTEPSISAKSYPVILNCGIDQTKTTIDGLKINWSIGDVIFGRASNQTWTESDSDNLTAQSVGESSQFTGNIRYDYPTGGNMYFFYSKANGFNGASASVFSHSIPAVQVGTAPSDHMLLWSVVEKKDITPVYQEQEITGYNINGKFSPFVSLLKFNLLSTLNVTEIKVEGTSLSATMQINPSKTWGTIGDEGFIKTVSPANSITLSNQGNVLSGDIYVAVASNEYDGENAVYCNNSSSLTFTFTNSEGKIATVSNTLKKSIQSGSIKNLGNITSLDFKAPKATGELTMMEDASALKLTVTGAPAGATFYYEIGDNGTVTPTITSTSFSAEDGFVIPTTDNYVKKMVRVLIHPADESYSDKIIGGYIRNWKTVPSSNIYTAYTKYKTDYSKSGLEDNNIVTADDLTLNKRSSSNTGYLNAGTDCLTNSNANFIARTQNDGVDFEFRYKFSGGTANKTLGINAGLNSDGYPSNWIESKTVSGESTAVAFVYKWRSDLEEKYQVKYKNVAVGTPISASGNLGTHNIYEISLLEKGENLIVPEQKETVTPAFKLAGYSVTPLVVIDTTAVGEAKLAKGAKFYYTSGTEGFDALATPTASSTEITKDGFAIKDIATKNDVLYVKVLATGPNFEDSYCELYLVSWHLGWAYEPDSQPSSSTQYEWYTTDKCPYYGLTWEQALGTNASWGNRVQFKNNCYAKTSSKYTGKAQMHLAIYSATADKQINWYFGGSFDSSTPTQAVTGEAPIGVTGPAKNVSAEDELKFRSNSWLQIQSISVIEQISWAPDFVTTGASISNLTPGSSINIQ